MIAYLCREPGADAVEELLLRDPPECVAHALNLCEVFYDFLRRGGEPAAIVAIERLQWIGLETRNDLDENFWKEAGRMKVRFNTSLADAVAIALAVRCGADAVTTDRPHFGPVAKAGVCRVNFIR
jgi:PIN domain nuclease of toxin-antitoxin system